MKEDLYKGAAEVSRSWHIVNSVPMVQALAAVSKYVVKLDSSTGKDYRGIRLQGPGGQYARSFTGLGKYNIINMIKPAFCNYVLVVSAHMQFETQNGCSTASEYDIVSLIVPKPSRTLLQENDGHVLE